MECLLLAQWEAANKLDPSRLKIADISQTEVCPLARIMRRELKKQGIKGVEVAFSTETPVQTDGRGVSGKHDARAGVDGTFYSRPYNKKVSRIVIFCQCTRTILNFQSVYTIKCRNKKRSTKRVFVCAFYYSVLMFIRRGKEPPGSKIALQIFQECRR